MAVLTRLGGLFAMTSLAAASSACGGGTAITASDLGGGPSATGGAVGEGGAAAGQGGAGQGGAQQGTGGAGGAAVLPPGAGVGEACATDSPCRAGLSCVSDACEPGGDTPFGEPCVLAAECAGEAQCVGAACVVAGEGATGETCTADADCADGLRCSLAGLSLQCAPEGSTDVGGACVTPADCFSGLSCVASLCTPSVPGIPVFGAPTFNRVECPEPVAEGETVRALFEVPGAAGGAATDFFSLPFPNDVRLIGGHPDLSGFPTPGDALFGFDPVARYVDAIEANATAWGGNPAVIFRFTGPIDPDTFRNDPFPVYFTDVTAGAAEYGALAGLIWQYSGVRSNALCSNWFAVRRPTGAPLLPGHTYAVWITDDGKAADGSDIERSPHFSAMLGDSVPSDSALAAAWQRFQPLRDFVASPPAWWASATPAPVPAPVADRLLAATVITVDDLVAPMQALAAAVEEAPVPTATDWVRCDGATPSPCSQAEGSRACGSGTTAYDEYHALVSLPNFQQGTPPYLDEGGSIAASPVSTEPVCLALTVPTGTMPAAGWPLVIHAHGTGGSFRSHVTSSTAGALSAIEATTGTVQFAVLGIDQVAHGPRRGDSTESPDNLFFNVLNPDAARGNPLQGAADQLALARFAATLDLDAATSGGAAIRIDPARMVFFGHSQGANAGSLALPFASALSAGVLSGNGASIKDALLTKANPVDIAAMVPYALGDPTVEAGEVRLAGGLAHPGLTLLSQWIDPADPLHFARLATRAPLAGQTGKHVFQTYGLGDTFSPPTTMASYAVAARLGEATPDVGVGTPDELGLTAVAVPAAGNFTAGGVSFTTILRQYQPPAGSDAHFVAFDVPRASDDLARFLGMAAQGELPAVGE